MDDYNLLDSGDGEKLEQLGSIILRRPSAVAIWPKKLPHLWKKANATFTREDNKKWIFHSKVPREWTIQYKGLKFSLSLTDFGHIGLFPEHLASWQPSFPKKPLRALNLFAYTGAATLALANQGNIEVCHVDASKKSVQWARHNAQLSGLENAPIRWITDDVFKFLKREVRRNSNYDMIILDPPSYGKGTKNELFIIERQINELLSLCKQVLSPQAIGVYFSCHTPGFTPLVMKQLMQLHFDEKIISGEMIIPSDQTYNLPSGTFAQWEK